jgi:hypothetical protein
LPEFHALVWKFGRSKPQPVYLPPYYEMAACRRRMRADPYFPSSGGFAWALRVAARALVLAALLAALVLGGAALPQPSNLQTLLPGFAPPACLRWASRDAGIGSLSARIVSDVRQALAFARTFDGSRSFRTRLQMHAAVARRI